MRNPKIIGILGLQGEGKTALATYIAAGYHAINVPVYANYQLKGIPYKYVGSLEDVQKVRYGVLILDEIWTWLWSRTSQSTLNKELLKIIMLNRKRGVTIIYTAQLKRTVDVILKEVTTYFIYPTLHAVEEDGKTVYYIKYIVKDILGRLSDLLVTSAPVNVIGQLYNTDEEIVHLEKNGKPAIEIAIGMEEDFCKAIKKLKFVRHADVLPHSGEWTSWRFDVLVYTMKYGNFCFDVKTASGERVRIQRKTGNNLTKQIQNANEHLATPYLAYPEPGRKIHTLPQAWFIYPLTCHCYLTNLRGDPSIKKLMKESVRLTEWQPPLKKALI